MVSCAGLNLKFDTVRPDLTNLKFETWLYTQIKELFSARTLLRPHQIQSSTII